MQSFNNNNNNNNNNNQRRQRNNNNQRRQNNQQQPQQYYDPVFDYHRAAYQQYQNILNPQLNYEYQAYQRFQNFANVILDKNQADCVMHIPTCACYECTVNNRNIYKRIYEDIRMYQMINDLYANGNALNINPNAPWNVNMHLQIPDSVFVCDYDINGNVKSYRTINLTPEHKNLITCGLKTFSEVHESFMSPASLEQHRKQKQKITELLNNQAVQN